MNSVAMELTHTHAHRWCVCVCVWGGGGGGGVLHKRHKHSSTYNKHEGRGITMFVKVVTPRRTI